MFCIFHKTNAVFILFVMRLLINNINFTNKIKGKYSFLITACLGIFTVALCVLFVFLIVGAGSPAPKTYNITLKNYTFYSVSLGRYQTIERANAEADKVIIRGGAGYIAQNKGYNVLASLYTNKNDALSVIKSLANSDVEAELFVIEIPKIYIKSAFDYSEILNSLFMPVDALCNLYYKIDGEGLALENAQNELANISKTLNITKAALEKQYDGNLKDIRIKAEFKVVLNYLDGLQFSESAEVLSLKIKQTQFKIIYGLIDLFNEIAD